MKTLPLTRGKVALVSDQDYARLCKFKWYCSGRNERPYAQAWNNGKRLWLKRHDTRREAARAYNRAAQKYFGKYACLNLGV